MEPAVAPHRPISSLAMRLFGTFAVERNGSPLPSTRTRKEQWLLALLVLHHQQADRQSRREQGG